MPEFVIHIGPHKTGSTFLQSTLAALVGPLREQGVVFPEDQGAPSHLLVPRKLRSMEQRPALAREIAAYVATGLPKILITAEGFATVQRRAILALKEMLGANPVQVVFYCRSAADIVVSSWGEQVKHGAAETLDELITRTIDQPQLALPVNYATILRPWAVAFGKQSLRLVSLEALAAEKQDTVSHFLQTFLGIQSLPGRDDVKVSRNEALPLVDAELIRALNRIHAERKLPPGGELRRRYRRQRKTLDLSVARAAAEAAQATIDFDESAPHLAALHQEMFAKFGANLVAPHLPDRFYTPRTRTVAYIDQSYQSAPGVTAQIAAAYETLTAR